MVDFIIHFQDVLRIEQGVITQGFTCKAFKVCDPDLHCSLSYIHTLPISVTVVCALFITLINSASSVC